MDLIYILVGILIICIIKVLNKYKLGFFSFIVTILFVFFYGLILFGDVIEQSIVYQLIWVFNELSSIIKVFNVYPAAKMLTIFTQGSAVTLFFDYECTGLIEIMVYISLVIGYPLFTKVKKLGYIIAGYIYLMITNIMRVGIILTTLYFFGRDSIFVAHMLVARLFYFIMTVILYFTVFTQPHIMNQKVGKIR